MCIQIYRRCICGHRENNGPPRRCQKVAAKSSSFLCFVPFAGPRLDDKGFCLKKKEDSFGVPEPCRKCIAEGGIVNHLGGQSYYYDGGAQGLAPLPPPKAYVSSSYSRNERHHGRAQMSSSRHDTQAQQPQVYREPAQRSTKYENPRQAPPRPPRSNKYAPEPDNKARKQSEEYSRKTIREAEKVSREARKKGIPGKSDKVDDIRARALAKAREEKRPAAEPSIVRRHGSSSKDSAYPAPLKVSKHRQAAAPAGLHGATAHPDIRKHPAMRPDVQPAAVHEAFTVGTHYNEDTRRFRDGTVQWGAASHPDRHRLEIPTRDTRRHATSSEIDRYRQRSYAASRGGYGVDVNGASPLTYSPPESQISAINVTQKLPYNRRRR